MGKLVKNCYEYGIHTGRASLDVGTERSNGQCDLDEVVIMMPS